MASAGYYRALAVKSVLVTHRKHFSKLMVIRSVSKTSVMKKVSMILLFAFGCGFEYYENDNCWLFELSKENESDLLECRDSFANLQTVLPCI